MSHVKSLSVLLMMIALIAFVSIASFSIIRFMTTPQYNWIISGEEGLNPKIFGYQLEPPDGTIYTTFDPSNLGVRDVEVSSSLPYPYSWAGTPTDTAFRIYMENYIYWVSRYEKTRLEIEVEQAWREIEPYKLIDYYVILHESPPKTTTYNTTEGQVTKTTKTLQIGKVKGAIYKYHFIVSLGTDTTGDAIFTNDVVWLLFYSKTWDKVWNDAEITRKTIVIDTSTNTVIEETEESNRIQGSFFSAPISTYYEWNEVAEGSGDHYKVQPSGRGRYLTLYSQPTTFGAKLENLDLDSQTFKNTFGSELAPDSRMSRIGFTPITIEDFGITVKPLLYKDAPRVRLGFIVYYLQIGEATFQRTEEEMKLTPWEKKEAERIVPPWEIWGKMLGDWFSNPLNQLGILIAIAVVVVVVFIFMNPWVLAIILSRRGKS